MPELYAVTCQVITVRDGWRSSVGVPTFWVSASSSDEAVDKARQVMLCVDSRLLAEIPVQLSGTVILEHSRDDYASFSVTVSTTGEPIVVVAHSEERPR